MRHSGETKTVSLRLPPNTLDLVDRFAERRGWSRAQWIARAVELFASHEQATKPVVVPSLAEVQADDARVMRAAAERERKNVAIPDRREVEPRFKR